MKYIPALSAVCATLVLAGCNTMNSPLTTSGSFDPLAPAGGMVKTSETGAPAFRPGQFVRATIDNTAFFLKRPKGDGDADKLLARDTNMKVISSDSSYVKVELDGGEVGFVPAVMVNDPNAPMAGLPGDQTIYPPVAPTQLPTFDTSQLPPPGSIPPIIDPAAPAPTPAPAAGAPGTAVPAAPAAAPSGSAPLPPGIDDTPAKPGEAKKAQ